MSLARLVLAVFTVALLQSLVGSIVLDVDDPRLYTIRSFWLLLTYRLTPESIRDAAATVAYGVQQLYNGNATGGVIGKFPFPP